VITFGIGGGHPKDLGAVVALRGPICGARTG
jgi:hypothetical protein